LPEVAETGVGSRPASASPRTISTGDWGRLHFERFQPKIAPSRRRSKGEDMFLESDTTVECAGGTPIMEAGEQARPQTCVWLWDRNVPHLCGNVAAVVAATR
jgi:hypothetical protein